MPQPHAENVSSNRLPGGDLIRASQDHRVMILSDRGGASGHIGDRWAAHCADVLDASVGTEWPVPDSSPMTLIDVIRLDDVPEVSRDANAHQLENPDFLLLGRGDGGKVTLQGADAKFAVDRARPSQVSAVIVENLLSVPNSSTQQLLDDRLVALGESKFTLAPGVFIAPKSELTDYLYRRGQAARREVANWSQINTIAADPETMFQGLPASRVIGSLARIDALPVTPRTNLISAVYYFRLASACLHLWLESHKPLLGGDGTFAPAEGMLAAEVTLRTAGATSAFDLIMVWSRDVEPQANARTAIKQVVSLPLRMNLIRGRCEQAGLDQKAVRNIRKELDIAFREQMTDLAGLIPADDPRSLSEILEDVAGASRSLAPNMQTLLDDLVTRYRAEADDS